MARSSSRLLPVLTEVPYLLVALSVAVLMGRTFLGRVGYGFDLEWMEGGMLVHGWRASQGLPLYVRPGPDFIPFIYPPLYSWLLGATAHLVPLGYALGRSISFAGTLAATAALVVAVRQEGRGWLLGLGAAALFLTTYDDAGSFFDLVRTDGLAIGLLAWALVSVRGGWLRAGGLLLFLAFATKQHSALFGIPAAWWLWRVQGRRAALRFAAWSVLPALAFVVAMQFEGDGLFLTYLLAVPATHPFVLQRFFPGAPLELAQAMPWTLGLTALVAIAWRRRWSPGGAWWVSQGGLAILLSAVMRGHHGGYLNVLIPGLWTLSLWSALAIGAVRDRWPALWLRAALGLLLATQLWAARWPAERYLPTPADTQAGQDVIERLQQIDGDVLAPWSPWYPVLAGKPPSFHLIALWDIDHEGGPLRDQVPRIRAAVRDQRWAAIMTATDKLGLGLRQSYRKQGALRLRGAALYPRTGWRVRPRTIWEPAG